MGRFWLEILGGFEQAKKELGWVREAGVNIREEIVWILI